MAPRVNYLHKFLQSGLEALLLLPIFFLTLLSGFAQGQDAGNITQSHRGPLGHNVDSAPVYTIKLYVDSSEPHGDLTVLPSSDSVYIVAEIEQSGETSPNLKELERQILWTCDAGKIVELKSGRNKLNCVRFDPPQQSGVATIHCELTVTLATSVLGGNLQPVRKKIDAAIHLLAPLSSKGFYDSSTGTIDAFFLGEYLNPYNYDSKTEFPVESDWYKRHPEQYKIPQYFFKVDSEYRDMSIGPNTYLDLWTFDFPWKSFGFPQYIALDLHLVHKLEDLILLMRKDGYTISRFISVYGFRPPWYNLKSIKSNTESNLKVPFSMHQYGRAIDFIIDEDDDLVMDDLNKDGKHNIHDAAVIMHYVNILDREYRQQGRMKMVGGAGLYPHHDFLERPRQTPYIHIDTRGFTHEDGKLIRWPLAWPVKNNKGKWIQGYDRIRWGEM